MDRALISTWGRVKGQIESKWVGVAISNSVHASDNTNIREPMGTFSSSTDIN